MNLLFKYLSQLPLETRRSLWFVIKSSIGLDCSYSQRRYLLHAASCKISTIKKGKSHVDNLTSDGILRRGIGGGGGVSGHGASVPIDAPAKSGPTSDPALIPSPTTKEDTWRLLKLVEPEKKSLALAVGLLGVSSAVTMSVPFLMGRVIDIINASIQTGSVAGLDYIAQVLMGVFLVGALANAGRVYLIQSSGHRIVTNLRVDVMSSILKKDLSFFDRTRTGELVSRLSADTTIVGQSLTQNLSDGLRSGFMCGVSSAMMLYISPELSGYALLTVCPVALFSVVYGRRLRNYAKQLQDKVAVSTQLAEERMSNIRTVKAFAQELKEINNYRLKNQTVLEVAYQDAYARSIFFGVNALIGNMIVLVVFYSGGHMMQESAITVGEVSSFLVYAAYMGLGLGGLATFYSELMRGVGASTRLWNLMESPQSLQDGPSFNTGVIPSMEILKSDISFEGINFAYPSRPTAPIFTDLNLHVPAGKITAVCGKSGTGKSTIASLLLNLYRPSSGTIKLRDVDIAKVNTSWLRSNIGFVAQEPVLFSTSIADNIRYGSEAFSVDVMEAALNANAHGFISKLPDGYDTLVGERGVTLSGGQKQRVAIARAILKNPSILILDEATSALDSESEALIQEALERFMIGRTVIVIAHRFSTIRNADNICVLDGGKVAEIGSYAELMKSETGIFRGLMQKQALADD